MPTDQLSEGKDFAERRSISDSRPEMRESYRVTRGKATDVIENDEGIRSKPVTQKELYKIAKEAKKKKFHAPELFDDLYILPEEDIIKQALKNGCTVALINLVIQKEQFLHGSY